MGPIFLSVKHLLSITVCSAYVRHYKGDHKEMKIIFLTMEVSIVREITNTCEKISENYGRKYISMILCVAQTQSYEFKEK